ncbi:DUF3152 domain-containing protein [Spirilliplanes yamanashiensis]|uniref:DUF3152 domain-containing protein n=1 Tax=Spirilliplanes yamanashiensis TaxID=42233 RepID=A0A8J3Y9W0_9ACTN|nr:DUF3152 domain-containing protein [Spirilliplanes yamanashiensis]MDP9815788.1 hypothetical protein [Spirilliplanes yamanashiensis]GIJ04042.1 hypothetical protein Sya03_33940 [Spirilliplanes yamanashiensis]
MANPANGSQRPRPSAQEPAARSPRDPAKPAVTPGAAKPAVAPGAARPAVVPARGTTSTTTRGAPSGGTPAARSGGPRRTGALGADDHDDAADRTDVTEPVRRRWAEVLGLGAGDTQPRRGWGALFGGGPRVTGDEPGAGARRPRTGARDDRDDGPAPSRWAALFRRGRAGDEPEDEPGDFDTDLIPPRGRPARPAADVATRPARLTGGSAQTRARPRPTTAIGRPPATKAPGRGAGREDWVARDTDVRRGGGVAAGERAYVTGPKRPGVAARPVVSPSRQRMLHRRRRSMVLLVLLVSAVLIGVDRFAGPDPRPTARLTPTIEPTTAPTAAPAPSGQVLRPQVGPTTAAPPKPTAAATTATAGAGFAYVDSAGPVLGAAGTVRRFRVAVEKGSGQNAAGFAAAVDRVLGDPRSWIASRQVRFQRVPRAAAAEFTIWLAGAATSQRMCASGGLHTEGYTSCRLPGHVVINLDRWRKAVPGYGAPLATYQAYALNHEVGHQLGHGHEACVAAARPAPVMQQQTYGLKGCVANAWPYVSGERYTGPPVR